MKMNSDPRPLNQRQNIRIDQVDVDLSLNLLSGPNGEARLEPRVIEVLSLLVNSAGAVVLREDMLDEHGSDEGVTRAISILRKALKKVGEDIKYIETIPKKGYRLVAPLVSEALENTSAASATPSSQEDLISIAVLAFVDMSENGDQGYLSDGVSEEIINALVPLQFLRVAGRTSSFSFRDKDTPVRDIAKTLNVAYVLEGSVRKAGTRLRITAQLIEASNDKHVWSENFDGEVKDIFELQESIAQQVEERLRALFSGDLEPKPEAERLTEDLTTSKEAYDHFLRGRHLMYELSGQRTLPRAVAAFEAAIKEDQNFAKAWANLAIANFTLPEYSTTENWRDHISKARSQTEYALELNPNLAWSHRAKAGLLSYDLKMDEATDAYFKAFELEPSNPELMFIKGYISAALGLHQQADKFMRDALDREPLIGAWYGALGTVQFSMGRLDLAEVLMKKAFDCNWGYAAILSAQLLAHRGNSKEAIKTMKESFDGLGAVTQAQLKSPFVRNLTNSAFFQKSDWARSMMDWVLTKRMNNPSYQPALGTIIGFIMIDRPEKFFQHVLEKPNPYVAFALSRIWEPTTESQNVRKHADFPQFAEKIGLIRAWQKHGWPESIAPKPGTDGSGGQIIVN